MTDSKLTRCRDCGDMFDPTTKRGTMRGGYVDQCIGCSRGDWDHAYLGRPGATNKDGSITIFRTGLATVRSVLRGENAAGYGANIRISHPAMEDAKQRFTEGDTS